MSAKRSWLPFVGVSLVGLVALLIAGSAGIKTRTFALGSPNEVQVALLDAAQQTCEGPIVSPAAVGAVRVWGGGVGGPASLAVSVEDATTRAVLASGRIALSAVPNAYTATLSRAVRSGRPLSICLTGGGPHPVSILGSAPVHPVLMESAGKTLQSEFSLVLLSRSSPSLLSSLPTAFSRAALFRPSWVGRWTFWLLTFALLGTIALGAAAIRAAARADEPDSEA